MPTPVADADDETLRSLVEALTDSGQVIAVYDPEDCLRYANRAYRKIFLGDCEGTFTFADLLRHGARHGIGTRIADGGVEALIARTYKGRRSVPRKSFDTDLVDDAGSGWTRLPCRTAGC
ncbi:hypothetical protein [Microvirga lotononidis]|uniref:PAS domain-containing protein n=1 Tax=Microvirga lotononidis TaxID=864069 RepID=I4Z3J9_9HYPH|nr:hypothetical protein [Microvirga lotononidis]EIM30791.1 hypothetical protein MicloDRAFT_00003180 [Microvirga lotononidis]WQO31740.1 hypothetical protein U0023_30735 [Microvirga lotononidis]